MKSATSKDIPAIVEILTRAFLENKSVNRCIKQDSRRHKRIENQIKYICRISLRCKMAFLNENKTGAVLCSLSNVRGATLLDDLFYFFKVSGVKLGLQLLKREKLLKQILPQGAYCHLWLIGVDNEFQSKGAGTKMISDLKNICSDMHLPIYLETSTPRNRLFYEKNGFKLYNSVQLPTDTFELYFYCWNPAQDGSVE